jgi:hypothetical protein
VFFVSCDGSCDGDNDIADGAAGSGRSHKDAEPGGPDSGAHQDASTVQPTAGEFIALTYNVAGLPEGISGSNTSVLRILLGIPRCRVVEVGFSRLFNYPLLLEF